MPEKIAAAAVQTASYEDQLRNGAQLDEDSVRALIALHGRSLFLRDLFLARFNRFMPTGGVNSIMTMEMQSYHLIGKYLAEISMGTRWSMTPWCRWLIRS